MLLCDKTQNAILIKISNFTVEVYVKTQDSCHAKY